MNKVAESDYLIFTEEIWDIEEDKEVRKNKLTIIQDKYFPYLDMEIYWNDSIT